MAINLTEFHINHKQQREALANGFCEGQWVTLYEHIYTHPVEDENVYQNIWSWCYIADPELTIEVLGSYEPDIDWDQRSALYNSGFKPFVKDGFESLITVMRFDEARPRLKQIRIHEDFIHMFHLYEECVDNMSRVYVHYDCGERKEVIVIHENEVKILHQYLYDFLAAKQMNLVCAIRSELNMPLNSMSCIGCKYTHTGSNGVTECEEDLCISNYSITVTGGIEFQCWYKGKKIFPYKQYGTFKSSFDYEYAEFITGYDTDSCSLIRTLCNDDALETSRTFFDRKVLEKYRGNMNVSILPYYIDCPPFWDLKCNNNHPDFIWTRLKDLRCIPYSEQQYWASCNIPFVDNLPAEYQYNHPANWNDAGNLPEYRFRTLLSLVNKQWNEKFGWTLFVPTTGSQSNAINQLFSLGDNNIEHFKSLIQIMNIVLTESINVKELNKLPYNYPDNSKGITKLSCVLDAKGYTDHHLINFLRQLNTFRSKLSDSHRNSNNTDNKLSKALGYIGLSIEDGNFREGSINLFTKGIEALESLIAIIPEIESL